MTHSERELGLQGKRDELSAKTSRLHSLQELEAQFAGYGRGIRTLLLADRFRGRFQGIVADAVETDEKYEAAVEAVLGERLQYVLSNGNDDVMEAIGFLKESSGGRCSFITRNIAVPRSSTPSGAVRLLEKVNIALDFHLFVEPLLAGVYLTEDIHSAFRLAGEFPELTFVTLQGELIHSAGIVHGGSMEANQQGVIHKKREIRELSREVAKITEEVGKLVMGRTSLQEEIVVVEEELRDLRQKAHQRELDTANMEKDLFRVREGSQRLEERLALKRMEDDQFREEKEILELEMTDSDIMRSGGEERKAALEIEVAAMRETLLIKRRELDEMREKVTATKVRGAALKEKSESSRRAETRVGELVNELHGRITGCVAELDKGNSEIADISIAIVQNEEALKSLMRSLVKAEAAFVGKKGLYESVEGAVQEEEGGLRSLRSGCEEARKGAMNKA